MQIEQILSAMFPPQMLGNYQMGWCGCFKSGSYCEDCQMIDSTRKAMIATEVAQFAVAYPEYSIEQLTLAGQGECIDADNSCDRSYGACSTCQQFNNDYAEFSAQ